MHRKSRALLLIAAALLLLTSAFADTAKAQEAGTWEELEAALANVGSVTLTADVEGSTQLYAAPGDTELDLNNFTITYSGAEALFDIEESLRITDENPNGCGKILRTEQSSPKLAGTNTATLYSCSAYIAAHLTQTPRII